MNTHVPPEPAFPPSPGLSPSKPGPCAMGTFLAVVILATIFIYAPGLSFAPFWDDYLRVAEARVHGFNIFHDYGTFFRPLEQLVNALNLAVSGENWALSHTASLIVHLFCGLAVWRLVSRLCGGIPLAPEIAAAAYLLHPMMVSTVLQIDTLSQLLSGFFALLTLNLLVACRDPLQWRCLVGVAALTLLGLLSKESYPGFALITPVLTVLVSVGRQSTGSTRAILWVFVAHGAAVCAAGLLYAALRLSMVAGHGDGGRYAIDLGWNAIKNSAMLLGSGAYLGNTVSLFQQIAPVEIALAVLPAVVIAVLIIWGFAGAKRSAPVAAPLGDFRAEMLPLVILTLATLAGLVPSILATAVSEHQASMSLAFMIALAVCLTGRAAPRLTISRRWFRTVLLVGVAGTLVMMAVASREKVTLAGETSRRAEGIRARIMDAMATKPADEEFVVCYSVDRPFRDYSIYRMSTRRIIEGVIHPHYLATVRPGISAGFREGSGQGCHIAFPDDR